MISRYRIGVYVHPWHAVGRDIIRGVVRYAHSQASWDLFMPWPGQSDWAEYGPEEPLDGAIVRIGSTLDAPVTTGQGKPRVVIGHNLARTLSPDVDWDNLAIGRMGAEHLIEQGHRSLSFYLEGLKYLDYQNMRLEGFQEAAAAHRIKVNIVIPRSRKLEDIAAAFAQVPRPCGVMAATDLLATRLLLAARLMDRHVPEELAVVGAGDDEIICEASTPELSSVVLPGETAGLAAAQLLARFLDGQEHAKSPRLLRPTHVAVRRSSDLIAIDDVLIARALRYIRQHAVQGITVAAVRKQIPLSRRALEIRFKDAVGRTIEQEIRRVQIDRARTLLTSTTLAMSDIAAAAGFPSAQRLSAVFQRETGKAPREFRKMS